MIVIFLLYFSFNWLPVLPAKDCILEDTKASWILGEAAPVGTFALQFYSVYSYAAISYFLGANLVLGPIFTTAYNSSQAKPTAFDHLFDIQHYIKYWGKHRVTIMTHPEYEKCFPDHRTKVVNRIPQFYANNRSYIQQMFRVNEVTFPLQSNTLYRLNAQYKFAGLYDFWYDRNMFKHTFTSLKPSPAVEKAVKFLLKVLPRPYLVAHVRLDSAACNAMNTTTIPVHNPHLMELAKIQQVVSYLNESSCFYQTKDQETNVLLSQLELAIPRSDPSLTRIKVPAIYLISEMKYQNSEELQREKVLIQEMKSKLGIHEVITHRTYTRKLVKQRAMGTATDELLSYEQLNYIDLLISRHGQCIIPAMTPSVLSYLLKRVFTLHKMTETWHQANDARYGDHLMYKEWGL